MKTKTRFNWKKLMARSAVAVTGLAVAGIAVASTAGGPFSTIDTFATGTLLPGVGAIGVLGGVGYGGLHFFKHDYGKGTMGAATAVAGGVVLANSSWFAGKAGVSAATLGAHLPLALLALHAIGL